MKDEAKIDARFNVNRTCRLDPFKAVDAILVRIAHPCELVFKDQN